MSQLELLTKVINFLNQNKIDYMLTGSFVSSIQGEPRSTHDIDIVLNIKESDIKILLNFFSPPDYYLDEESIRNALKNRDMFNLIDVYNGDKIDFWIYTDDSFDKSRFSRKYIEKIFNNEIFISTPEDTILAKLKWCKLSGGSKKQFIDALRIYELQKERLDIEYITKFSEILNIKDLWEELKKNSF